MSVLAWMLGNALHATLLACGVALAARLGTSPALTRVLWLLVLVRLIAPPIGFVPWSSGGGGAETREDVVLSLAPVSDEGHGSIDESAASPIVIPMASPEAAEPTNAWSQVLGVWVRLQSSTFGKVLDGALILVGVVLFAVGWTRTRQLRRTVERARDARAPLSQCLTFVRRRLGVRRLFDLKTVAARVSPFFLVRGGRPTIVFPDELSARLDASQRQLVLAHEVAHFRARDHWVRAFELLCTSLFWWCPTLWWARRRLRAAQEICCDRTVLQTFRRREDEYARALLAVSDYVKVEPGASAALAASGSPSTMFRRLEMILSPKGSGRMAVPLRLAGGALVLAGFGVDLGVAQTSKQEESPKVNVRILVEEVKGLEDDKVEHVVRMRNAQPVQAQAQLPPPSVNLNEITYLGVTANGVATVEDVGVTADIEMDQLAVIFDESANGYIAHVAGSCEEPVQDAAFGEVMLLDPAVEGSVVRYGAIAPDETGTLNRAVLTEDAGATVYLQPRIVEDGGVYSVMVDTLLTQDATAIQQTEPIESAIYYVPQGGRLQQHRVHAPRTLAHPPVVAQDSSSARVEQAVREALKGVQGVDVEEVVSRVQRTMREAGGAQEYDLRRVDTVAPSSRQAYYFVESDSAADPVVTEASSGCARAKAIDGETWYALDPNSDGVTRYYQPRPEPVDPAQANAVRIYSRIKDAPTTAVAPQAVRSFARVKETPNAPTTAGAYTFVPDSPQAPKTVGAYTFVPDAPNAPKTAGAYTFVPEAPAAPAANRNASSDVQKRLRALEAELEALRKELKSRESSGRKRRGGELN